MLEYADNETEDVLEYIQRADGPRNFHTVAAYTSHAEPLKRVHGREVTGYTGVDRDGQIHGGEGDQGGGNHPQERNVGIELVRRPHVYVHHTLREVLA